MNMALRKKIIDQGVPNLREYGYPGVTKDNILTDEIYSAFFKSMLKDNKGKGADEEVEALLSEIAAARAK